jgi:hypothetical protein
MDEGRQPTLAEAVEILMRLITRTAPARQIQHWRELYGDVFADQVRDRAREEWRKKGK